MEKIAKKVLEKIKNINNLQAEVFINRTKGLSIEVEKQEIKAFEKSDDLGIGLRIFKDGKMGFSFCSGTSTDAIDYIIENAIKSLDYSTYESSRRLPENRNYNYAQYDRNPVDLERVDVKEKIEAAKIIESSGLNVDKRITKTNKSSYRESEFEIYVNNTSGICYFQQGTMCGCSVTFIAEEKGVMESGWEIDSGRSFEELNFEETGKKAANKALRMIGAKPISTGLYPVILDNIVAMEFLQILSSSLCADQVQKGKSMFHNKIGELVASENITLEDNGFHPGAITYFPADSEGIPVQGTKLIEKGILKNFLYDTYTANKENRESTGNGFRPSYKSTPSVGISNLFITAEETKPFNEMVSSISKGLYVTEAMGVHTANPVTGDFSFGVEGMFIENGKISFPVRGVMIAGNIIEMIKHIEMVEDRLRFIGRIGAPAIKISSLSVSGN
ncbi:MAG: TldD/PmbA family protein [Candidatus Schekmanbacteria bacterium]|nr:MAG: TldD/PmbA family protein [Candidatus Schekmanbacteria bacterium]